MKKSDIRDYMIVETGFDDKKYLVIKGKLIDGNLEGFSLENDFNEKGGTRCVAGSLLIKTGNICNAVYTDIFLKTANYVIWGSIICGIEILREKFK